jgi:Rha family phage regulatory protein
VGKLKTIQRDEYGVTVLNGTPVVSSRKIAEVFEKRHDHILRDIRNIEKSLPKIGESKWSGNYIPTVYKNRGKEYPEYQLTEDGFTLLAMGFTGDKALKFKITYIERFNLMKKFIEDRQVARIEYPELTAMIHKVNENPNQFHYSNEADMINKIVLGMKSKEFKIKHDIRKGESPRDYMQPWEIEGIKKLQQADVALVATIPKLAERKRILSEYFKQLGLNMLEVL